MKVIKGYVISGAFLFGGSVLAICVSWNLFRQRFEISPLLSNIVPNYSAVSFRTNPVGRNDGYG